MKRYYRNRFILGAMLAFIILMALAISGIWFFSYRQMERETDDFIRDMQNLSAENGPAFSQAAPPMFGYTPGPRRYPSGFYDILTDANGEIQSIQQRGITEEAGISVQQYVQQAVAEKHDRGKTGSYKYGIEYREDGTARVILLDISIQLQALYNMLKSALSVGIILAAALLLILLPVSSRVAAAYMRNNERQKQFITDAGHDLKTPIAIMRSNLDVMELMQGKSKWSGNIRSQVSRLERLVEQLVMMARLEESEFRGTAERFDLSSLLREQWENYAAAMQQKGVCATLAAGENLWMKGQKETLRQMLNLLLDNAVQYCDEKGSIHLAAEGGHRRVVLKISNSVTKLPAQPPQELTERFTRGDAARSQKSGGAGIGLSAVRRIAELHHGKLKIEYQGEHLFCAQVELPGA